MANCYGIKAKQHFMTKFFWENIDHQVGNSTSTSSQPPSLIIIYSSHIGDESYLNAQPVHELIIQWHSAKLASSNASNIFFFYKLLYEASLLTEKIHLTSLEIM